MDVSFILNVVPPWIAYLGTTAIVVLSIYFGFLIARLRKKLQEKEEETAINTIVAATLGLLAFILAFTFGATTSRFDTKRELLLNEVNAIETTYLRTSLIPEPHRSEVRKLLRQYVDIRVELMKNPKIVAQVLKQSGELQRLMWQHVAVIAESDLKNPDIVTLFVDSMNQMFDLQTKRVTVALVQRLPPVMWATLYILVILSMFEVGYLFGISGRTNWPLILVFSIAFASVIMIIVDLDSATGLIKLNPKPMIDLAQRIKG